MKYLSLITAVLLIGIAHADEVSDKILSTSGRTSNLMVQYSQSIKQVDDEHNRKVADINSRLLVALKQAKAQAMSDQNLDLAVAIDKKVKEVEAQNDSIQKNRSATSTSTVEESSFHGTGRKLAVYVKGNTKLKEYQRKTILEFAKGKLAIKNTDGDYFYIDKAGVVCDFYRNSKVNKWPDASIEENMLVFGNWSFSLTFTESKIPMFYKKNEVDFGQKFEQKDESQKAASTNSNNDDSLFGRRAK